MTIGQLIRFVLGMLGTFVMCILLTVTVTIYVGPIMGLLSLAAIFFAGAIAAPYVIKDLF